MCLILIIIFVTSLIRQVYLLVNGNLIVLYWYHTYHGIILFELMSTHLHISFAMPKHFFFCDLNIKFIIIIKFFYKVFNKTLRIRSQQNILKSKTFSQMFENSFFIILPIIINRISVCIVNAENVVNTNDRNAIDFISKCSIVVRSNPPNSIKFTLPNWLTKIPFENTLIRIPR